MGNGDKLMRVEGDDLLPGRVLDHLIARYIFGWRSWRIVNPSRIPGASFEYDALVPPEYDGSNFQVLEMIVPPYSTDIAAAWTVLEKIGLTYDLAWLKSIGRYSVRLIEGDVKASAFADTAPHAICMAALQIVCLAVLQIIRLAAVKIDI